MTRRDLPAHITRLQGVLYFRRRGWRTRRLVTQFPEGAPIPEALYAERLAILNTKEALPVGTGWPALVDSYKRSSRYTKLKPRTRADYDKVLAFLADRLGPLDPALMQRKDVHRLHEANRDTMRFANYCVQVLRVLFDHAMNIGLRADNPAKGLALFKSERPARRPWPPALVAAFREAADPRARLIFELCLGTGQRIGDVLKMRWNLIHDGGIDIVQGKTDTQLWVPFTRSLAAVLADMPRRGLTIIADDDGRPLTYFQAAWAVLQVRKRIGAEAYDIHSLRYTAAAELVEVGCSDELVAAVTGHKTASMVAKYAGPARQRTRAKDAQGRRK
jgi:integrase